MQDGNARRNATKNLKPQQQTGEDSGSIKKGQLDDRSMPERADLARGAETGTRAAGSRRG